MDRVRRRAADPRALTRLRFLTLQRGKELAAVRWTDIDGDWFTLPASVTKNKQAHRVYLTQPARDILRHGSTHRQL